MTELVIKLPDVGEGVAEAEIAELLVKVGDAVKEDQPLAAVLTDKATVEIPSPAVGRVTWVGYAVGDVAAVGSPLVKLELNGHSAVSEAPVAAKPVADRPVAKPDVNADAVVSGKGHGVTQDDGAQTLSLSVVGGTQRAVAAPAVRAYARERGVDLRLVTGSGAAGRILRADVDAFRARRGQLPTHGKREVTDNEVEKIKVAGLRRAIAHHVQDATRRIPHFSYIEEIDVTELEALRAELNAAKTEDRPRLTVLPFLMCALVRAVRKFPEMNARFVDENDIVERHRGVHLGIATQTPNGLMVPVVRHVEVLTLWQCAAEIARIAAMARAGSATRDELSGSTLSITSLGALGGLATTPIINAPEVAIVGVNKISVRPVWRGNGFEPRKIMNLSSSFDHRVIDGWNAAEFIQYVRSLLESPARIFVES